MKRTIKQTLADIRALGLSVSYNSEYKEYRVDYRKGIDYRWTAQSTYFTTDALDALNTAKVMTLYRRS